MTSLLKRSFEGQGYCQSDFEDAAIAIVWLESHGLNGLEICSSQRVARTKVEVNLTADEQNATVVDLKKQSIAFFGRSIVDLACAGALAERVDRLAIQNCCDQSAILPSLCNIGARGLHALAYWNDDNFLCVARIVADQRIPSIRYLTPVATEKGADPDLNLVCSKGVQNIDSLETSLTGDDNGGVRYISSTDFANQFDAVINSGIEVNDELMSTLVAYADTILVESTEQSRLGAGE
ncbi:MAG: DUF3726 domain-containing protein [Woeseiaceae bacterium]